MRQKHAFSILGILLLLLAGCGTGETISFKGVPLDQPGVKDALKKICQESGFMPNADCSFNKRRELIFLSYGVLANNLAWITIDKDDSLVQVEIMGSKGEMLAQVDALSAKYGKPLKNTEHVTNGLGAKFDKDIFTWTDSRGSRITVESIYSEINKGRIVIDSPSTVAAKKITEKSQIKAGRENL